MTVEKLHFNEIRGIETALYWRGKFYLAKRDYGEANFYFGLQRKIRSLVKIFGMREEYDTK